MINKTDEFLTVTYEDVNFDPKKYIGMGLYIDDILCMIIGHYDLKIIVINDLEDYEVWDKVKIKNPDYKPEEPEVDLEQLHNDIMTKWMLKGDKWFQCHKYDPIRNLYWIGNWVNISYLKDAEFLECPPRIEE